MVNLLLSANDTKALAAVLRGLKELQVPKDKLKANQVPTLALVGENDSQKKSVDELDGKMAKLKIVVLKKADHMTAFTRPEFVTSLQEFLRQQASGPKSGERESLPAKK
jgi:pimeloyl-ACP methyl ester carboxylesterase